MWSQGLEQATRLAGEAESWQLGLAAIVVAYAVAVVLTWPQRIKTPDYYRASNPRVAATKRKMFPPPYPNGWFRICASSDVDAGAVKSISALGREFVAFRGEDGKVGVLDAFCPHLGAHLGQGGTVKNGLLTCPFHEWAFDTNGKVQDIPYCRTAVPQRAKTRAWPVREFLGMVFIWFHAEPEFQEKPQWELEFHKDCLPGSGRYLVTERQTEFNMHTLHAKIPLWPLDSPLSPVTGDHDVKARYFEDADPEKPHVFSIVPQFILRNITANVTFEGPSVIHFKVDTIFGSMRMIKTLLPCPARPEASPPGHGPPAHHLNVQARWFADATVPRPLAYAMSILAGRALEQERHVWEHKTFRDPPCLVAGDGPYIAYKRYYVKQFYSASSRQIAQDPLDW
ncbi:Chlorophyllide a oxygenase, chloroplastic [Hondaea fermentalgiana]|uniref:cholesterol 7-desaturase n=1 Tax=Hondaea fermentalgiana TaxID=2315210 RepID=A0A2R5GUB5_9STRA|nr:Chlorophyllide a oxygenase, chloroplastic [Hondaea fermentalgiana]|eukprot:GBG33919.1 Chlorophyllide a oxygenase, chloroplastic [Hondaea fermentalgiana]